MTSEDVEPTLVQEEDEPEEPSDKMRDEENKRKLEEYICQMTYQPTNPEMASERTEGLAKPKKRTLIHAYKNFGEVLSPKERRTRLKRLTAEYRTMTPEQFQEILKKNRRKERKLQQSQLQKQEIFYDLLQKLESQSRRQYLNVMTKKFADFISKLATTMRIPEQLVDPYARMQRGIFCNILTAIGAGELGAAALKPKTRESYVYSICEKLSHAILSLIIKGLDAAAYKDPNDIEVQPLEENDWDTYIKDRLLCAVEKKCVKMKPCLKRCTKLERLPKLVRKCTNYDTCYRFK